MLADGPAPFGEKGLMLPDPYCGWLKMLKNSVRKWILSPSRTRTSFCTVKSKLLIPFVRSVLRPSVPVRPLPAAKPM